MARTDSTITPRRTRRRRPARAVDRRPASAVPFAARRGNTLVLVAAILVLLVVAATAFLSRTRSGRSVSAAENSAAAQRDAVETMPEEFAGLIADALFPAPIDIRDPDLANPDIATRYASPNWPRLSRAIIGDFYGEFGRYSVDPQDIVDNATFTGPPDGRPDFSYNFAPYEVVPWTNWPQALGRSDDLPGEPGFGDTRWLRSTEPNRWDPAGAGFDHRFSHWTHLTYIPNANNGWRVLADIADITAPGNLVDDLRVPIEQWPQEILFNPDGLLKAHNPDGSINQSFWEQFGILRDAWFGVNNPNDRLASYENVYGSAALALPNLFDLKTLGPRSHEAFAGTARNSVARTFADADGDGVTDAFWMLAPAGPDSTLRHLVAVSIVDNGGLLDVNTATRFVHRDPDDLVVAGNLVPRTATTGRTPADLALIGQFGGTTGTGFLDSIFNAEGTLYGTIYPGVNVGFSLNRWSTAGDGYTLMDALGIRGNGEFQLYAAAVGPYLPAPPELATAADRFTWWRAGSLARNDPRFGLTPFGLGDEIELRAFHGQNIPTIISRFERAVNTGGTTSSFLRSTMRDREETSEYLDQLLLQPAGGGPGPSQLLFDNRRKLTTQSATRHDVMPSWLWPTPLPPIVGATDPAYVQQNDLVEQSVDIAGQPTGRWTTAIPPGQSATNFPAAITVHDLIRWSQLIQRFDLRGFAPDPRLMIDTDGDGTIGQQEYDLQSAEQRLMVRDRLLRILVRVFLGDGELDSYFGSSTQEIARTRSLIASYAANVEMWMGALRTIAVGAGPPLAVERPLAFNEARAYADPSNPGRRFVGNLPQPFIMEAYVAHVYAKSQVPASYPGPLFPGDTERVRVPLGQPDEGSRFVDGNSQVRTIAVVQIANPYTVPIVLAQRPVTGGAPGPSVSDFRLRLFNQGYTFNFNSCDNVAHAAGNPLWTRKIDTNDDGDPDWEQLLLLPCTEDEPRTAIVYAIPDTMEDPSAAGGEDTAFGAKWRDFLDIGIASDDPGVVPATPAAYLGRELFEDPRTPQPDTLRFRAGNAWSTTNPDLYDDGSDSSVELLRNVGGTFMVVDRIDFRDGSCNGPSPWEFRDSVARLRSDLEYRPPDAGYVYNAAAPANNSFNGIRLGQDDYFVTWARVSRHWANDFIDEPPGSGIIDARERAPRYAIADRPATVLTTRNDLEKYQGQASSPVTGDSFRTEQNPDTEVWFIALDGSRRKPTYFTTRSVPVGNDFDYPDGFPVPAGTPIAGGSNWVAVNNLRVADKVYGSSAPLDASMQMVHPFGGFERVGDLALVPMWGPVVELEGATPSTVWTLPEILAGCAPEYPVEETRYLNRIRLYDDTDPNAIEIPGIVGPFDLNAPIPNPQGSLNPGLHRPFLPAGTGLFDAFVCDGPGAFPRIIHQWTTRGLAASQWIVRLETFVDSADLDSASPRNAAGGYGGLDRVSPGSTILGRPWQEFPVDPALVQAPGAARGLVNINTASLEVLRSLPHLSWLVHSDSVAGNAVGLAKSRVRVPEAIIQYRDRAPAPPTNFKPGYADRGHNPDPVNLPGWYLGMRSAPGFASIGELLLLRRSSLQRPPEFPSAGGGWTPDQIALQRGAYRIDFARANPWEWPNQVWPQVAPDGSLPAQPGADARISTDLFTPVVSPTVNPRGASYLSTTGAPTSGGDGVVGDAKESSLLFAGLSNLVSVRSDLFTVYFRVRTVRQNPVTGRWNGMDPSTIVDEARYVMAVDRSAVRRPGDRPRILFLEKLPP